MKTIIKKDKEGYLIAEGHVFLEYCRECNKEMKCYMLSFYGNYLVCGYRFKCLNGHIFTKEIKKP